MSRVLLYRWGIFPLWLLLASTIFFRNPIPIDETRYLSVAWEMWLRNDFLVPYLNGQPYSHKPPLLFWLFQAGWTVFGVNEWWPRLIGPIAALVNLIMLRHLAGKLWPANRLVALKTPWILIATLLWTLFATSTMFDILLTCCVLLGMVGLIDASQGKTNQGWFSFGLAIGIGLLAKGPVIFLHLIPTAGLVVFWHQASHAKPWFFSLALATAAGCALAFCWALPAAATGGEEYASAILWHQTADRTVGTKIHVRAFYWYLPFLPLLLFPWVTLPRFWRNLRSISSKDTGLRFSLIWLVSTLAMLSLLPSKQVHYLIPCLPAFALLCSYVLAQEDRPAIVSQELAPGLWLIAIGLFLVAMPYLPGLSKMNWVKSIQAIWGLCVMLFGAIATLATLHYRKASAWVTSTTVISAVFVGFLCFFHDTGLQYNLRPAAQKVAELDSQYIPLAFVGDYQGQLHFLGRLTRPIKVINKQQTREWAQQHPSGILISLEKAEPQQALYAQPHREYWLIFRNSEQILSKPST